MRAARVPQGDNATGRRDNQALRSLCGLGIVSFKFGRGRSFRFQGWPVRGMHLLQAWRGQAVAPPRPWIARAADCGNPEVLALVCGDQGDAAGED